MSSACTPSPSRTRRVLVSDRIAVPTAITGFYGQNLPYPGFSAGSGFAASSALIVGLSAGLFVAFKRKDWL